MERFLITETFIEEVVYIYVTISQKNVCNDKKSMI